VDGLYGEDPATNADAEFLPRISVSELRARNLQTLPIEPAVLELMANAKLAKEVHIVNGLKPGELTRALAGEPAGTTIYTE
jgi:molybdenum storage protein